MVGEIDQLAILERLFGHDFGMPEAVMVDEALRRVAMRLFNRDIIHIAPAPFDRHDLVDPVLALEPLAILDICVQRRLFARKAEADLLLEDCGGFSHRMDMPAAVFVWT